MWIDINTHIKVIGFDTRIEISLPYISLEKC